MNFSEALEKAKNGAKIQRNAWRGNGTHVELQRPDQSSKMNTPYLYMVKTGQGNLKSMVPWTPTQTDLMAEDWGFIPVHSFKLENGHKLFAFRSTRREKDVIYKLHGYGENGFYKRAPELDTVIN